MNQGNGPGAVTRITRITCPKCGIDLNPHAEKVMEPRTREEAARMDAALGGVLEQVHTCPKCRRVESVRFP